MTEHDRFDRLESLIDALAATTQRGFAELRDELRGEIRIGSDTLRADLRGEMHVMRDDLRREIRAMGDELRGEMRAMGDELRGEMRGMGDEIRGEMRAGFAAVDRRFDCLEERVGALESRGRA